MTKLDLILMLLELGLQGRENSSTLDCSIRTLSVTKAKPCGNIIKWGNKKTNRDIESDNFEPWTRNFYTSRDFSDHRNGKNVWCLLKKLSQLILTKRKEELSRITYDITCEISYALRQSCLSCIRGKKKSINE